MSLSGNQSASRVGMIRLLLTTLQFLCINAQPIPQKYPVRVSLGAYPKEVEGSPPLFYETFIPLIYEYQVPAYKTLDVTLRDWRSKCETDNYLPSYTCPVFYHFERFLERFEEEVVPKAWMDTATGKNTAASPLLRYTPGSGDFCNKIQKHFKGTFTRGFDYAEYLEALKQCSRPGSPTTLLAPTQPIDDYVFNLKNLFKKMNDNYENEFSNKFFGEANKKFGPAYYVNALTSHQNGLLIAYLSEKERWEGAKGACAAQQLPHTLLKPQNVSKYLNTLNSRLLVDNQETAVNVEELSSIFKLPLTDCSFIESSGNFVVRILIPVKRRDTEVKMMRLSTTPFISPDGKLLCELNMGDGGGGGGRGGKIFLQDVGEDSLRTTECSEQDALCQVGEYKDAVTDPCIKAIFAKDLPAAKMFCRGRWECVELPKDPSTGVLRFPLISQVGSDSWVIIGKGGENDTLSTKCDGASEELTVELESNATGALELRLPCLCHILFNGELLYPSKPCSEELNKVPEIRRIFPPQFIRKEYLDEPLSGEGEESLAFAFEPEYLREVAPTPTPTTQDQPTGRAQPQPHEGTNKQSALEQDESETKVVALDDGGSGAGTGQGTGMLWALVILELVLICFIFVFGIYRYSKYKKEMGYSKERLVYNIYSPQSDPNLHESASSSPPPPAPYRATTTHSNSNQYYIDHL